MKPILVIGGGIAGIQAALDLAQQRIKTYLIEKEPSIGGRMMQLDKTFPTLDCAACILTPRMAEVAHHENIELITYADVREVTGSAGNFRVRVIKKPRYVKVEECIGCGVCMEKCPTKGKFGAPDEFNAYLTTRTAAYIPFPQAVPLKARIDPEFCLYFQKGICRVCEKFCPTGAIDFEQKPEEVELNVAAIILTTGFSLREPRQLPSYGYGRYANVYTSLEFERLISATGPTGGRLVRRSDGKPPESIGFIQCVCSRDVRLNPNCSAFCCMASVKQSILAKEHDPEIDCMIFFIDVRAFQKGAWRFCEKARKELGVKFIYGRPASVEEEANENLVVVYEDTLSGRFKKEEVEMLVLATGVEINPIPINSVRVAEDGFVDIPNPYVDPVLTNVEGIFVAGVTAGAKDVSDSVVQASAAAMRASILARVS